MRAGEYENSPTYDMTTASSALDLLRQRLPEWAGGYSDADKLRYSQLRAADPELARATVEIGKVPGAGLRGEVPTPGPAAATAQAAGVVAGDVATDGVRNIWWFLNAPQAVAHLATQHAMFNAGKDIQGGVPLLRNRGMRMAASMPAWIGLSLGIGNFMRQPGYKAVVPGDDDPRETESPMAEFASRYFLGRSGRLLPYDEFVKERPDVSKAEYQKYKSYLFGSPWPLKATAEGIHGPEVTFMGKSMPVATTLLPAVAATIGTGIGIRRGGRFLATQAKGNQISKLAKLKRELDQARSSALKANKGAVEAMKLDPRVVRAGDRVAKQERYNEGEVLKRVLGYSGGGMVGTAALGQALESIRRASNQPVLEE
jgi:hypothetical protein